MEKAGRCTVVPFYYAKYLASFDWVGFTKDKNLAASVVYRKYTATFGIKSDTR